MTTTRLVELGYSGVNYGYGTIWSHQTKGFAAHGRIWLFYVDFTDVVYCTTLDGINWSSPARATPAEYTVKNGATFSIWFDGIYAHYVYESNDTSITYRRGLPQATGTIAWDAAHNVVSSAQGYAGPSICTDSSGFPYIIYKANVDNIPYLIRSSTKDGTWTTDTGFPIALTTTPDTYYMCAITPLTGGKVYAIFGSEWEYLFGRLHDGAQLGSVEAVTPVRMTSDGGFSICSMGDVVYVAQIGGYGLNIAARASGAWAYGLLSTDTLGSNNPVISYDENGDLHIVWLTSSILYCQYQRGGVWQAQLEWPTGISMTTKSSSGPVEVVGGRVATLLTSTTAPRSAYAAVIEIQAAQTFTLTVDEAVGGITVPAAGSHQYNVGQVIQASAIADSRYVFKNWVIDGTQPSTDNPLSVTMDKDTTITPVFEVGGPVPQHLLTMAVIPSGGGTTTPAAGSYLMDEGASVNISAIPTIGYLFVEWQEGGISLGSNNPAVLTMDTEDRSITAVFEPIISRILTMAVVGNGITDPAPGTHEYPDNAQVIVTAIPDVGNRFVEWEEAGVNTNPLGVTMNTDRSMTAVFEAIVIPPDKHAISISIIGDGSTTPPPETYLVDEGTSLQLSATPADGWMFSHWEGSISTIENPIIVIVNSDMSITAVFTESDEPTPTPTPIMELIMPLIVVTMMAAMVKSIGV